ncbi:MAG: SemiSWEET family transporter [bacterium]
MWKVIGFFAASLTMFGFVPQIVKMFKTKSVENVSLLTLIQISIGVFLWALYGFHLKDIVIIFANMTTFFTLIIAMFFYFKFKKGE